MPIRTDLSTVLDHDLITAQSILSHNQTVGGYESWDKCKRNGVLKSSGHYCTIAGDFSAPVSVGNILQIAASRINRAFWSWTLDPTYHDMIADPDAADLNKVTEMIERGLVHTRADSYVYRTDITVCLLVFFDVELILGMFSCVAATLRWIRLKASFKPLIAWRPSAPRAKF
jgi:hypothetical protein